MTAVTAALLAAAIAGAATPRGDQKNYKDAEVKDAEVEGIVERALTLANQGRFAEADSLVALAAGVARRKHGGESPLIAAVLSQGLVIRYQSGRAAEPETRRMAERALEINERALGPYHPEVASSLNNLAAALQAAGDYPGARSLYERALKIYEEALGPEHLDLANSLNNLSVLRREMGDYAEARILQERALEIQERALGPEDPSVATSLNNLSVLLRTTGDYTGARALSERALKIQEHAQGPEGLAVSTSLNNLALILFSTGDYSGARSLHERALRICEDKLGPESPEVAVSLGNIASVLSATGDYGGARPLRERALRIREHKFGPNHPAVATSLNNLAQLLYFTGDYAGARPLYERALRIREHALSPTHSLVALTLSDLAQALSANGDYAGARPLMERALRIQEQALGPEHEYVGTSLNNLAGLLRATKDFAGARLLSARALKIREDALGPKHPQVAQGLNNLARVELETGEVGASVSHALRAETIAREHLRLTARALSEREALAYATSRISGLDVVLSAAVSFPDSVQRGEVWDTALRGRALVLDEMATRHRRNVSDSDPEIGKLDSTLSTARTRLANLVVRGTGTLKPDVYRRLVHAASAEEEQAERALAARSAPFRLKQEQDRVGFAEVALALPEGSALVGYLRYSQLDIPIGHDSGSRAERDSAHPAQRLTPTPSYLAFVLRGGERQPELVKLGPAAVVDSLVKRWREEMVPSAMRRRRAGSRRSERQAEAAYRKVGDALRQLIWDPVAKKVGRARRVFIVPDGPLSLINFAAFPVGKDEYILDRGPLLQYLSAERDLVKHQADQASGHRLLLLGGPDFDRAAEDTGAETPGSIAVTDGVRADSLREYRGLRATCADFRSVHFMPLPGTVEEVKAIATLWDDVETHAKDAQKDSALASGVRASLLMGVQATEAAFKKRAPRSSIVHLATHGFFLGGSCESALDRVRAIGGLTTAESPIPVSSMGDNPLRLSGLALAGANKRDSAPTGRDDGVLTAEEIAAIDLSGVRWVVLSACDTGVGEVKSGEGVFGLRRAFQVAGVGTLIMSLWPIDDQATRTWMVHLYEARLSRRLATAESVQQASLEVLKERRDRRESTHPFYWAGFVAAGDWR